jgi:hypothetical protein
MAAMGAPDELIEENAMLVTAASVHNSSAGRSELKG